MINSVVVQTEAIYMNIICIYVRIYRWSIAHMHGQFLLDKTVDHIYDIQCNCKTFYRLLKGLYHSNFGPYQEVAWTWWLNCAAAIQQQHLHRVNFSKEGSSSTIASK